jgi:hypothetical protein
MPGLGSRVRKKGCAGLAKSSQGDSALAQEGKALFILNLPWLLTCQDFRRSVSYQNASFGGHLPLRAENTGWVINGPEEAKLPLAFDCVPDWCFCPKRFDAGMP